MMLDAPVDITKGLPDDTELLRRYNTMVMRLLDDLTKDEGTKHGTGWGDPPAINVRTPIKGFGLRTKYE